MTSKDGQNPATSDYSYILAPLLKDAIFELGTKTQETEA